MFLSRLRLPKTKALTIFLVLVTIILILVQIGHLFTNSHLLPSKPKTISFKEDNGTNKHSTLQEITSYQEEQQVSTTKLEEPSPTDSPPQIDDDLDEEYFRNQVFIDYQDTAKLDSLLKKNHQIKEWMQSNLLNVIQDSKPSVGPINDKKHYNKENEYVNTWNNRMPVVEGKLRENNIVDPIRTKQYLSSFLQLSNSEIESLKNSHQKFLESMPKEYPESFTKHSKGSGILYPGGGNYNWLVLISLKMLRDLGSKLPVEVFIPTEAEYSIELCENVFPIFGAKCIIMSNYINTKQFKLKGYQLKSVALLLTSFEKVLMLDSDNLPVKNPDYLFESEVFEENGLVIWPDFWRRSTSPMYYDIVGIEVDEMKQVRKSYGDDRDNPKPLKTKEDYNTKISYHDLKGTFPEASSESGQILINKKTHAQVIFLSLYYNYYGPDYYYGLMSQGQAGEGDKETIIAAAHRLKLPYYQVQEFIREYGMIREDGGIEIAAMGQYDPEIDYRQSKDYENNKSEFPYDATKDNYQMHKFKNSETMFLHCNSPKLYPWNVRGKGLSDFLNVKDGKRRSLYSKYLKEELGFDFEMKLWKTIQWLLCEHGDLNIKGMRNPEMWCEKVNGVIQFLESGEEEDIPSAPATSVN